VLVSSKGAPADQVLVMRWSPEPALLLLKKKAAEGLISGLLF
jgi:hypothetical protein